MPRKRREKGTGSVRQIKNRYYGRLTIDGKQYSFAGPTAADVRRQMRDFSPEDLQPEKPSTVKEWMESWMSTYKKSDIKASSFDRLECTINHQILPALGKCKLCDLTPAQLSEWLWNMKDEGLSYSTIKKAYDYLQEALRRAVVDDLIQRSPMEGLKMISKEKFEGKKIRFLTPEESAAFIRECRRLRNCSQLTTNTKKPSECSEITTKSGEKEEKTGKKPLNCSYLTTKVQKNQDKSAICSDLTNGTPYWHYGQAFVLMISTGVRAGEAVALRVEDWDKGRKVLHIRRNAAKIRNRDKAGALQQGSSVQYTTPKSSHSVRDIPLPSIAQEALQQLTRGCRGSQYIIRTSAGTPATVDLLRRSVSAIYDTIGVNGANLHSLRHTYASTLFAAGIDLQTISHLLGHASTVVTSTVYVHLLPDATKKAAAKIEAALSSI